MEKSPESPGSSSEEEDEKDVRHMVADKVEALVQKRFAISIGPAVPDRQQSHAPKLLQRTGPPRPKALQEFIKSFIKSRRQKDADPEPETQAALENFNMGNDVFGVGPDSLQASRSLDSFVVSLLRRPKPVARETTGKTKTDATSVGYVGLRVGLAVGEGGGVDWNLVVLEVDQVVFTTLNKLKRNDRILRVGDKTELSDMIAHLKILDSTGGQQVEQIEIEATAGPDLDDVDVAEAAVPVSFPDEEIRLAENLAKLDMDVSALDLVREEQDLPFEAVFASTFAALQAETEAFRAGPPLPNLGDLGSWNLSHQIHGERLRRAVFALGSLESLELIRSLTPSVDSRAGTPTPLAAAPPGLFYLDNLGDMLPAVAQEVEALSQAMMLAVGGAAEEGQGGGGQLWRLLVAGCTGSAELNFENEAPAVPLNLLWLEALFKVGAAALKKRRKDLDLIVTRWCLSDVNRDWALQLRQIDETLHWVEQVLDGIKAYACRLGLTNSRAEAVLRKQEELQEQQDEDLQIQESPWEVPAPPEGAARSPLPLLPIGSALRVAKLDQPSRLAVRDLQHCQRLARKDNKQVEVAPRKSKKPPGEFLCFRDWCQGPAGTRIVARMTGKGDSIDIPLPNPRAGGYKRRPLK